MVSLALLIIWPPIIPPPTFLSFRPAWLPIGNRASRLSTTNLSTPYVQWKLSSTRVITLFSNRSCNIIPPLRPGLEMPRPPNRVGGTANYLLPLPFSISARRAVFHNFLCCNIRGASRTSGRAGPAHLPAAISSTISIRRLQVWKEHAGGLSWHYCPCRRGGTTVPDPLNRSISYTEHPAHNGFCPVQNR